MRAGRGKMPRFYCFMIGRVIEPDEKGECPECGPYISTHNEYAAEDCGHFIDHRHCCLTIDHEGPCQAPQ